MELCGHPLPGRIARRDWAVGIVLGVLVVAFAQLPRAVADDPAPVADTTRRVRVIIDYGDGCERHYTAIPWKAEMTALDALLAVAKHPRGVEARVRGRGERALVESIDGLSNEGGEGKNWIFRVDDQLGDRSAGITELQPATIVTWKWEAFR